MSIVSLESSSGRGAILVTAREYDMQDDWTVTELVALEESGC